MTAAPRASSPATAGAVPAGPAPGSAEHDTVRQDRLGGSGE